MLIKDCTFQHKRVPQVAVSIATRFSRVLAPAVDSRLDFGNNDIFSEVCEQAIQFKLDLIASPEEYRFFFFIPGDKYNPDYMVAEDEGGYTLGQQSCIYKTIKLCLFPGISQYQSNVPRIDPDDITTTFSYKKPFTFQRMDGVACSVNHVIAKAVVLMEGSADAIDTKG